MSVSIIAIDIAKSVFQVVGGDSHTHPVFEHRTVRKAEKFYPITSE